ncbi:hypothetical protein BpHYR1_030541 [Brachionus plicatilis]|uniref:Uncharacterized protein n=1 Tax=Brachionus plicatilis TaxID=10195 RepID=A0A3M7S093_BRAPC|nr:hypothetical protein BpHYR1_030541 [Brachionus plicatilis]
MKNLCNNTLINLDIFLASKNSLFRTVYLKIAYLKKNRQLAVKVGRLLISKKFIFVNKTIVKKN